MDWLSYIVTPKGQDNIQTADISKAGLFVFPKDVWSEDRVKIVADFHEFRGDIRSSANDNCFNVYRKPYDEVKPKSKACKELTALLNVSAN